MVRRTTPLPVVWLCGAAFCATGLGLVLHLTIGLSLLGGVAALVVVAAPMVILAYRYPDEFVSQRIRAGILCGGVATVAYDGARYLAVSITGSSIDPFGAWPLFGAALVGSRASPWVSQGAGVAFHVVNGVGFGVAYSLWFGSLKPWWGVAWAMALEAAMLAIYPGWLDVRSIREFTQITMVGHMSYGLVLGFGCRRLLDRYQGGINQP
jgi:hypothetical protein